MNQRMTDLVRKGVPKSHIGDQLELDDLGWDGQRRGIQAGSQRFTATR